VKVWMKTAAASCLKAGKPTPMIGKFFFRYALEYERHSAKRLAPSVIGKYSVSGESEYQRIARTSRRSLRILLIMA
jgi:hypothetical protein